MHIIHVKFKRLIYAKFNGYYQTWHKIISQKKTFPPKALNYATCAHLMRWKCKNWLRCESIWISFEKREKSISSAFICNIINEDNLVFNNVLVIFFRNLKCNKSASLFFRRKICSKMENVHGRLVFAWMKYSSKNLHGGEFDVIACMYASIIMYK